MAVRPNLATGWALAVGLFLLTSAVGADPVSVTLQQRDGRWQMLRNGAEYRIKGAGGSGPLEMLAASGANSLRTWGVDDQTGARLDEAQRLGLTVTVGLWLGHERHGFRYDNFEQVARQRAEVLEAVQRFKDHPAVLAWGLGNEMEGFEQGDNPAIWSHIDSLAAAVKQLDPHHPTMTVIAEIGGRKVEAIHRLCPNIDIVGINSYGGATSLPERYRKANGVKPYVLTEYGPPGTWEVGKTEYGAVAEPNSNEKAALYARAYRAVMADEAMCLGSYAFTWGWKQEATATWFGLLLPGNRKTPAVDTLQALWSGQQPANRCPSIEELRWQGSDRVDPGKQLVAKLSAHDPERQPISVEWVLAADPMQYNTAGDVGSTPPTFPAAIVQSSSEQATIQVPAGGGVYRLFAYVRDPANNTSVANLPFFVSGPAMKVAARKAELPVVIAGEAVDTPPYAPSGWMGETAAIAMDERCVDRPHSGDHCLRVEFKEPAGWGGVAWQSPPNDWGDQPGGLDLTDAKQLSFWIRGQQVGTKVKAGFGLIGKDKKFPDSAKGDREIVLTTHWQEVVIPLAGLDLSRIKTGFFWTVAGQGQPLQFDIDEVKFE